MPPIYLDNHATTQLDPRVAVEVMRCMTDTFGNASSREHCFGDEAESAVKKAKEQISSLLDCSPREIVLTSGATESLNLAIKGAVTKLLDVKNAVKLLISPVEHKAVIDVCEYLAKSDARISLEYLTVDSLGRLDIDAIGQRLNSEHFDLLAVMAANNEVGNIYPVVEIAKLCAEHNSIFVCDGTQAIGKTPLSFSDTGIDMLAFSAHKIYGPKGVGALIKRRGIKLAPLIHGGQHQNSLRSGTLNVPGIVGLGWACHFTQAEMIADQASILQMKQLMCELLKANVEGFRETGDLENKLVGNLHFSVRGIPNDAVISRIRSKLAISTGSACTTGVEEPSHVLQAMGLRADYMEGSFRLGIGKFNSESEIREAAEILTAAIRDVREFFPVENSSMSIS